TFSYQWRRCGAGYPSVVSGDSPRSLWRLGEASGTTATSETATGSGTYQGGVTLGQAGAFQGDANPAVALNGIDGAVSLPSPSLTGPFTIELWAFLAGNGATGATGYGTVVGYDSSHRILWQ